VSDGEQPVARLPPKEIVGYAAGDAANNTAFSMSSMFLLLYYTDVVGISAAAVGTLFLVVRGWDAFADLFAGRVVEKTSTRWGKFRPFLIFGSIPLLLLTVAIFSVPDLGEGGELAYAYVSYALFGLAYSLVNIPYGSLATAMTQDPTERARLAGARVIGSNLAILLLAVAVSPQIEGSDDLQRSLTITTVVLAVVGYALYVFAFRNTHERVERDVATVSGRQAWETFKQNRALLVLCLSGLAFLTGWFSLQTVTIYYARDVLGSADYYIVLTVVQTAGFFAAALLIPVLVRTIGKKRAYLALGLVAAVAALGVGFSPSSVPGLAIAFFGVLGFGLGGVNTLMFALAADTVEYGEWKTGYRIEGTSYAVFSFTRKVGQAVGAAAAAYAIGIGGYVAGAQSQPGSAVDAIKFTAGVVPAAFVLVAVAIMTAYPLTEERFRQIVAEVARRRARGRPGGPAEAAEAR
jgi:glucuronide carrier protein